LANQATSWAALLSSIAAILNAIAWPGVVLWFLLANRVRLAFFLKVFGDKLNAAKKVKVGQIELDDLVEDAVVQAGVQSGEASPSKSIPKSQLEAAKELSVKVKSADVSEPEVLDSVRRQIDELAQAYEASRKLPGGSPRTRRMNAIAAGMRTLAIAGQKLRNELTESESVGRRLAAICILQVEPRPRYFKWLIQRVKEETQPFVFYQAAVAILLMVKKGLYFNPDDARADIAEALNVIQSFQGGPPDKNTIDALTEALQFLQ
jgi:hypothetical protein